MPGEQRADLVAAQHPPALRSGDGHRAAVGVGVVGDDDVGGVLLGEGHRQVHRPRLLGVGEGDGGEVGVGLLLLLHHPGGVEAGRLQHLDDRGPAHAVQRGVDDVEVAGAVAGQVGGGVEVAVDDGLVEHLAGRSPRHLRQRRHPGDVRGDLGVGGGDDLAAVAEVDLVAVVLRRVVTGGHHHPGGAAQLTDRVREDRGGQRSRQHVRGETGAGHHLGGVLGEDVAVVPGVVPDHDTAGGSLLPQVRGQPGRGPHHHDPVHPVRPGAEGAAKPGGAELQGAVEPVGEVRHVSLVRGVLQPGDELLELGAGPVVGVLGGPVAGATEQVLDIGSRHGRTVARALRASRRWTGGAGCG